MVNTKETAERWTVDENGSQDSRLRKMDKYQRLQGCRMKARRLRGSELICPGKKDGEARRSDADNRRAAARVP